VQLWWLCLRLPSCARGRVQQCTLLNGQHVLLLLQHVSQQVFMLGL
jgi:hypothetical protein